MISIEFELNEVQSQLIDIRTKRRFTMRCTEDRLHQLVNEAYTEDALRQVLKKYGLCDVCDFSALEMSAARVLVNCVVTAVYKYPRLRSKMCYIGSRKGYLAMLRNFTAYDGETLKALGVQHICDPSTARTVGQAFTRLLAENGADKGGLNTLAQAISGIGLLDGILLDEEDFSRQRFIELKKELEYNVKSRFYPQGCTSVAALVYHEIGHLLDYLCGVSGDPRITRLYNGKSREEIKNCLSGYGSTSVAEFIAEGFSEYMSNPTPRECARAIGEVIEKRYCTL